MMITWLLANEFGGLGELMRGEAPAYARVQGEGVAPVAREGDALGGIDVE